MGQTFTFHETIGPNPATGLVAGQSVELYRAVRFALPATKAVVPDGLAADYSGTTDLVVDPIIGGVEITVNTFEGFYARYWDPADTSNSGTFNTYWLAAWLPQSPTNLQGWTKAANYPRTLPVTAIAAGSDGAVLPQGTINVGSTAGWATSGWAIISGALVPNITAVGSLVVSPSNTASYTLAVSPVAVGNCLVVETAGPNDGTTTATAVSGGGCSSWVLLGQWLDSSGADAAFRALWLGVVTAVGGATITVTWSAYIGTQTSGIRSQEFSSGLGTATVWALDGTQAAHVANGSSSTPATPTLVPSGTRELYFGMMRGVGDLSPGGTAGFTYVAQSNVGGNYDVYNTSVSSSASASFGLSPAGVSDSIAALITASVSLVGSGAYSAVQYTGITSTTLTGCTTASTATLHTGNPVFAAYQNGPNRREVTLASTQAVTGASQTSDLYGIATVGGQIILVTGQGIDQWTIASAYKMTVSMTLPVDPGGVYGFNPVSSGGGALPVVASWTEEDF